MADDMDLPPLNEWVVDELTRTREDLKDLAQRHDDILNRLTGVCRNNDELRAAGVELSSFVGELIVRLENPKIAINPITNDVVLEEARKALDRWREANV